METGKVPRGVNKPAFQLMSQAGAGNTGRASSTSILGKIWPVLFSCFQFPLAVMGTLHVLWLHVNLMQPTRFLFFFFWLRWVFVVARGLFSSCGEQGLLFVAVRVLLLLWSTGSRRAGFSSCGSRALERRLSSCGARA